MEDTQPGSITQGPHNDTYVIHFDFADTELDEACHNFEELCADLTAVGLAFQVRPGEDQSLLVFVRVPKLLLRKTVFKSRLKDYFYGTTNQLPALNQRHHGTPAAFEAEDLLSVYHLVNWPPSNGGAGVTPQHGKWQDRGVQSIFPLHNSPANRHLLAQLSKRVFLSPADLDHIRDLFGSKVAFYFAFMQTYFLFLFFPAATGLYTWLFLPSYSFVYAVVTLLGCTVFIEYWKIQQARLSVRWDVSGVGHVKINRSNFRYDRVTVDEKTGRKQYHYAKWKLVARQLLQVPFFLAALVTLGVIVSLVFALEVLVSEVYDGAYKNYLEYLPTVVLAIGMPYINTFLEDMAVALAEFENHRTQDNYEMSASQKMFFLSFISNYLPILLTAFVYVPMGDVIVPQLQLLVRSWLARIGGSRQAGDRIVGMSSDEGMFQRDPDRLRNEVVALTVTGQVSDMFEEMIVPYLRHRLRAWWREYKLRRLERKQQQQQQHSLSNKDDLPNHDDFTPKPFQRQQTLMLSIHNPSPDNKNDTNNEAQFLAKARHQASLPPYNVQDDLSEMVIQFGYLALFSPAWPLVSVGFLVNNWIELRSDFLKICVEHQRPHPTRSDGIGSGWVDSLDALALLGSISTGAIVHLFGGGGGADPTQLQTSAAWLSGRAWLTSIPFIGSQFDASGGGGMPSWWSLPVTIFISEHIFLTLRASVRFLLKRFVGSDVVRHEREERYERRSRQWEEMVREADAARGEGGGGDETPEVVKELPPDRQSMVCGRYTDTTKPCGARC
ncbi:calcium-activated chloride channel-domain-containing protein [Microdochium trichocladiopsis]|uniref:Calcium-activated chloride channel-domain-containing protein n=1 Tax=Microdochium trichocladiopsis TaxID=1682393 RepID=A0A9P8Y2L1_9PEZI|nr:calcium-activated chloride channel-domain-containing protein [Microdochium trichocladiopsis]KAH7029294.1 calcium-activated chloride channel-domain-containing protein [Microdochium trichocladiopsis]